VVSRTVSARKLTGLFGFEHGDDARIANNSQQYAMVVINNVLVNSRTERRVRPSA